MIKGDTRKIDQKIFKGVYGVIDLAALSNDVTGEKFVKETYDINFKSRLNIAKISKKKALKNISSHLLRVIMVRLTKI